MINKNQIKGDKKMAQYDTYAKRIKRWFEVYEKEPRTMIEDTNDKTGHQMEVHYWIILNNCWEYYLGEIDDNGNAFGYVMGHENEWGTVNVNELSKHISGIAIGSDEFPQPAIGFRWETQEERDEQYAQDIIEAEQENWWA